MAHYLSNTKFYTKDTVFRIQILVEFNNHYHNSKDHFYMSVCPSVRMPMCKLDEKLEAA